MISSIKTVFSAFGSGVSIATAACSTMSAVFRPNINNRSRWIESAGPMDDFINYLTYTLVMTKLENKRRQPIFVTITVILYLLCLVYLHKIYHFSDDLLSLAKPFLFYN